MVAARGQTRRPRWPAVAIVAGLVAAGGCTGGTSGGGGDGVAAGGGMTAPTFAAPGDDTPVPTSRVVGDDPVVGASEPPAAARLPAGEGAGASTTTAAKGADPSPRESVAFDDPIGDATASVTTSGPPDWSDLAGASLERQGNAYRLTIRLGGQAPARAPGPETMNIATYFDIDGDAAIEKELWVNLGPGGWGPVWYDDEGRAARGDRANVNVEIEADRVRLLFPDVMLDAAPRLRLSVASEYGPLSSIGTTTARRDDAPDDDGFVSFP